MITINDNFHITTDRYNWIVNEKKGYKAGASEPRFKQTFHGNLHQAIDHIIDTQAKDCESLEEVKEMLKRTVNQIEMKLTEKGGKK